MHTSVLELQGCYRVEVICPKCGKPGLLFISKRERGQRQFVRIYHRKGDCRVSIADLPAFLKDLLNHVKT